jgi:hypothetical protein
MIHEIGKPFNHTYHLVSKQLKATGGVKSFYLMGVATPSPKHLIKTSNNKMIYHNQLSKIRFHSFLVFRYSFVLIRHLHDAMTEMMSVFDESKKI